MNDYSAPKNQPFNGQISFTNSMPIRKPLKYGWF